MLCLSYRGMLTDADAAENEGHCEISGRRGRESSDTSSDDGFYLLEATTHQPQHPVEKKMEKKVESEGEHTPLQALSFYLIVPRYTSYDRRHDEQQRKRY